MTTDERYERLAAAVLVKVAEIGATPQERERGLRVLMDLIEVAHQAEKETV